MVTLEELQQNARKTIEIPPRVAVHDVIALAKGFDQEFAAKCYMRLWHAGQAPECDMVAQDLVRTDRPDQDQGRWGGNRKPVRVATAAEMIQILMQLPGNASFKQRFADAEGVPVEYVQFLWFDRPIGRCAPRVAARRERPRRRGPSRAAGRPRGTRRFASPTAQGPIPE